MKSLLFGLFYVVMFSWAYTMGYSHGREDGVVEGNLTATVHAEVECVK